MGMIREWVDELAYIRDKLRTTRTAILAVTMYMFWDVVQWVMRNIESGVIQEEWMAASIIGPLGLLAGAVFKFYGESSPKP